MTILGQIHHVGLIARDIEADRDFIHETMTVVRDSGIVHDVRQDADLCLLELTAGAAIELVSGPRVANLRSRGHTYYHTCFEVDDVHASGLKLRARGGLCVVPAMPAVLFNERLVAFFMTPLGLIELLERER